MRRDDVVRNDSAGLELSDEETFEQRPEGHGGGAMQYLGESILGRSSSPCGRCKGLRYTHWCV